MDKTKTNVQLIFSFSIICLALAIVYFAYEVDKFLKGFPEILVQMEKTSVKISPVIDGIAETSRNILPIAEEVGKVAEITPEILEEVRKTREALPEILDQTIIISGQINQTSEKLPDVLEEVRQTRAVIPGVLDEIRQSREVIAEASKTVQGIGKQIPLVIDESENIRKELPPVLSGLDKASDSVQAFTGELGKVRPMIPLILEEVRQTREEIPAMLDQAERITTQGQQFGADAGKGVVSGIISIFNPITLSRHLTDLVLPGKNIQGLTADDMELIRESALKIVQTGHEGTVLKWNNPESRNYGKHTVLREFVDESIDCKEVKTEIWIGNDKSHDFNVIFCHQEDGSWIRKGKPVSKGSR